VAKWASVKGEAGQANSTWEDEQAEGKETIGKRSDPRTRRGSPPSQAKREGGCKGGDKERIEEHRDIRGRLDRVER
jgi:hypothetical protein